MTSTIRVLYPDLLTEGEATEVINTGDQLDVNTFLDLRSEVEVQSSDEPVTITGGQLDDTIIGGQFADTINGGDGDDVLNIGPGDIVTSGGGDDVFEFDFSQDFDLENFPTITDFVAGEDEIVVSNFEDFSGGTVYDTNTGVLLVGDRKLADIGTGVDISTASVEIDDMGQDISPINSASITVFRFYNPSAGVHFYTVDEVERDYVLENLDNYDFEGESYDIIDPITGGEVEQVYRFFNPTTGVHLYTTDEFERDTIIDTLDNFNYEGVKFYAYETQVEGSIPVHRFYEPTLGVHFYTPSEVEKDSVMENLDNYDYEGIAYYAMPMEGDM